MVELTDWGGFIALVGVECQIRSDKFIHQAVERRCGFMVLQKLCVAFDGLTCRSLNAPDAAPQSHPNDGASHGVTHSPACAAFCASPGECRIMLHD